MATWISQRTGTWSVDAANPASPWNGGGNPASGVPANNDTVTIATGHVVTFDVDQSGFANGITLTITGTLEASTTAGTYKLKLAANTAGSGTLRAGTAGTPYPTNCTFEIIRNTFSLNSSTMTYDLNCTEPAIKWVKITGVEAAGQTILSVDTDVTADPRWVNGAILRIVDVNTGSVDTEERIFSSATSNTITITAGLTNQKEIGAYILLMSRNVRLTHTAATGNAINSLYLGRFFVEIYNASNAINEARNVTMGGTMNASANGVANCTVSSVIVGACNGNASTLLSTAWVGGTSAAFTTSFGMNVFGVISGCTGAMNNSTGIRIYGRIDGCNSACSGGGGHRFVNATVNTSLGISNGSVDIKLYNTLFNCTTEATDLTNHLTSPTYFHESFDHDQVANAYRAWTRGGIVDSDTGTVYTGRTRSYKHACSSASAWVFQNRTFTVEAGGGLVVQCYVRKSVTMAYLPRVWVLAPGEEPFITGVPTAEDIMTDSIDTWEELNLVYANAGTSPKEITVRTLAKNTSGNVYFDPIITVLAPVTYDVYNTLLGLAQTIERKVDDNQALIIAS